MKYTVTTLEKIEKILQETGYVVRYERGNFQSGYCILEEKKALLHTMAEALLERETLEKAEIDAIFAGKALPPFERKPETVESQPGAAYKPVTRFA